jgi:hypothetical protein
MLVLIWISSSHWFHNLWVTVLLKVNFSWESSQASLTVTPFFECWEPSQVLLNFKHDIDRSESRGCSLGPFLATKPPNSGTTATILLMFDPQLYPCVRKKKNNETKFKQCRSILVRFSWRAGTIKESAGLASR